MPTLPRPKQFGLPLLVVLGVLGLVGWSGRPSKTLVLPEQPITDATFATTLAAVDRSLADRWQREGFIPAEPADDLTVLRRLSLTLHGTVPSLETIRQFEADDQPNRIDRWTGRMLQDPRFGDYFAERFSRVLAGTRTDSSSCFAATALTHGSRSSFWTTARMTRWPAS